jgi:hypothetical protein
MIHLNDVVEFCKAQALAYKLYPSEEADWRWFCREYSKTFHTPLHQVLEMEPEHVILCVFEDMFDSKRLKDKKHFDQIVDELRRLEDPNYDATKANEMDDWVAGVEEWDDAREEVGLPIPIKGVKSAQEKELPKEGGINLAYLSKEEEKDPDNGFEE